MRPPSLCAFLQHLREEATVHLVGRGLPSGRRQPKMNPFRLKFCGFNVFPILPMNAL